MRAVLAFTLREAVRKRLALAALVLTAAYLALYGLGAHSFAVHHNVTSQLLGGAGIVLLGIYLASPLPVLLSIFVLAGSLSADVESGLLYAVLARPLSRTRFVLGRYTGYALVLALYAAALQGAVLALAWTLAGAHLPRAGEVVAITCLEPLAAAALTLLASSLLPTLAAGAAVVLLYGLASIGGVMGQVSALGGPAAASLARVGLVTSLLLPTDALYRIATGLALHGAASPLLAQLLGPLATLSAPSPALVVWALLYVPAAVAGACWVMSRRDF